MSREIDYLIAENIFNRKICRDSRRLDLSYNDGIGIKWKIGDPKVLVTNEVWNSCFSKTSGFNWGLETVPNYSTNIADAWRIVEEVWPKYFRLEWCDDNIEAGEPYYDYEDSWIVPEGCKASTAPMAICLAALKCKGVEVKLT